MSAPRPTHTPAWAKGMRKLASGIYIDGSNAMHICELEICESAGVPYTEAASKIIHQKWSQLMRQAGYTGAIKHVDDDTHA